MVLCAKPFDLLLVTVFTAKNHEICFCCVINIIITILTITTAIIIAVQVTIINRSPDKVIELRKEFPDMTIELELMDKMWDVIANSDVVYPSTAATTTIIDAEPLKECLKGRLTRPGGIQFIDISVPRNVHADCADIPGEHC